MRVLEWNIWHGGRDPDNLAMTVDLIAAVEPDVFLCVETYGAADAILAGLPGYTATRVTSGPRDNLWIFTRLPVLHVYPPPHGEVVNDFRFGGIRVAGPGERAVNVFVTWLNFTEPWLGDLIDTGAPAEQVLEAERVQLRELTDIVHEQLPRMLAGDTDPVILGGDLNALATSDWPFLRTTRVITEAGFTDTFRAVSAEPGHTWSTQQDRAHITIPERIDFIFAKGLRVRDSRVIDRRLPIHPPGPFYSDHAALVTDFAMP